MAGTKAGGAKAAATNKERYGSNYYASIGKKGGTNGRGPGYGGGFSAGEAGKERARIFGQIGGRISRRGKAKRSDD